VKRTVILGLTLFFALAVSFAPAAAGSDAHKDCAKKCPVTSCPMKQKAEAKKAEVEAKSADHDCDYEGKCEQVVIKLEELSGDDAEAKLTKTLVDTKGVVKVCAVDRKAGTALFCYDPDVVKKDDLIKTVCDAGFKASVEAESAKACPHHK